MDFFTQLVTDPPGFYASHELLIAQIGINSILAISIFLTLYSGQLTLANVGFMAIGAYTTVILDINYHVPVPAGMALGALFAGLVGFVVGLPVLRLRGVFLAIATLGFGEALRNGVILNLDITGRGQGLKNPDANINDILPILVTLAVLATSIVGNVALLIAFFVVASFMSGVLIPAFGAMTGLESPRVVQATVFGFASSGIAIGFGFGPLIGGLVAAAAGVQTALVVAAGIALALVLLLVTAVREPRAAQPSA